MSNVAIRPATNADLPALRQLITAFHQAEDLSDPPNLDEAILHLIRSPQRGGLWIAIEQERAVGFVSAVSSFSLAAGGETLAIDGLYVAEGARSRSIGRMLIAAVEAHGEIAACRTVTLEIHNGNRKAQLFFATNGFTPRLRRVWERPLSRANPIRPAAVPMA